MTATYRQNSVFHSPPNVCVDGYARTIAPFEGELEEYILYEFLMASPGPLWEGTWPSFSGWGLSLRSDSDLDMNEHLWSSL